MSDQRLDVLADVLAAIGEANTARAMVRAVASRLELHVPIARVELHAAGERCIAERVAGEWQCVEAPRRPGAAITLVPGLAIALARRARLPETFADPGFLAMLAQVIDAGARHLAVIQRVAELSRRAHVASRELRVDLERLTDGPTLIARSAAMRAVAERAAMVARHPTTVLLIGESGTGKEVIAREIHRRSPRAHRPMLQINCGAIPEALVESELFGHERGAFTGADRRHAGVFERAHRGTLLLDEVGDLPPAAQVKLLRVLQERQVRRVGGSEHLDVDVRVIGATHRALLDLVREGRFREDLYYRLEVFAIAVPPLRDRKGDLAPLVAALVAEHAARLRLPRPPRHARGDGATRSARLAGQRPRARERARGGDDRRWRPDAGAARGVRARACDRHRTAPRRRGARGDRGRAARDPRQALRPRRRGRAARAQAGHAAEQDEEARHRARRVRVARAVERCHPRHARRQRLNTAR
ncbi:MAG: sigma-54 factor interaction domain-containing protein [Deltaproteobacteria bacterium]|nr:sigma-54 factor interaction domain-containing protein [Deltaproteobacteria bacterium]